MAKYRSKKTIIDGITFDSLKEARRYRELRLLEKAGAISDLRTQVRFVLIPAQREPDGIGKRGGKIKGKLMIEGLQQFLDSESHWIFYTEGAYDDLKAGDQKMVLKLWKIQRDF